MSKKETYRNNEELDSLIRNARKAEQRSSAEVTAEETEKAYRLVAHRIDDSKSKTNSRFFKFAAAALVLIGLVGIGYLLTPKTITVPNGTTRTVALADGSTVTLNSGSELSHPRWFNYWNRSVFLNGEAFFEVSKNNNPFQVKTGNALVTVTGTKFNVRSRATDAGQKTSVFLQEGSITFSSKENRKKTVKLAPGQASSLSAGQTEPAHPKTMPESKAIAWMQSSLAFDDQPLTVIFNEISRRFDVNIKTKPESLGDQKLTIYISTIENVEQVLTDISRAKNLRYSKNGNTFIVTRL